jgi:hypothetical protein
VLGEAGVELESRQIGFPLDAGSLVTVTVGEKRRAGIDAPSVARAGADDAKPVRVRCGTHSATSGGLSTTP